MVQTEARLALIVEDTVDLAGFVKLSLEEMGFEASHAVNAQQAIDFLEENIPDVILLDIGLPGMSGWQLLDIINKFREEERIFIVVTTAFQDPANRLIGKLQHVAGYLYKPFPFLELKKVVMGLFEPREE
jgi:two-component system response regulator CpxR